MDKKNKNKPKNNKMINDESLEEESEDINMDGSSSQTDYKPKASKKNKVNKKPVKNNNNSNSNNFNAPIVEGSEENENPDHENLSDDELEDLRLKDLGTSDRIELILQRVRNIDVKKEIGDKEAKKDTRLIIEKIELENFKSYQGLKVIGPLYHKFNAVVGPNGSGKSNLMESLLFVFGKRAKKMRLKKLSELIHKSAEYPNIRFARVSVFFKSIKDNPDGTFIEIPNTEFVLTREVNKSSVSKYFLNKAELSFEDLCPLLEAHGIDLKHNRFLILQGEVEQISMLAPKAKPNSKDPGLLEYLEDIVGTKRYVKLIDQLAVFTEEIVDVKANKEKLTKIARAELDKLEEIKNISIQYFKEEKEMYYVSYLCVQVERYKISKELQKLQAEIDSKTELKKQKESNIDQLKRDNQDLLNALKDKKKEQAALEEEEKNIKKKVDELELIDQTKRDEIHSHEENIKKHEASRKNLMSSLNELMEQYSKAKADYKNIDDNLKEKLKIKDSLDAEIRKIEHESSDKTKLLQAEKDKILNLIDPQMKQIGNYKFEMQSNEQTYQLLYNTINSTQVRYDELSLKESSILDDINKREEKLKQIDDQLNKERADCILVSNDLRKNTEELAIVERELNITTSKLKEAENENKSNLQKSKLLSSIMNARQSGILKGIIGRLGDLGSIDSKYDVAISTCCPQLESIVVENVENAEKAIQFLKQNNLGRSTFIILSEMQNFWNDIEKSFNLPNNTERLFDLVKMNKNEYAPLFYYALRNTLVAPDLKVANEVGYGSFRHRVVTINGELIEPTGSISGGGVPKKGLMSNKRSNINDEISAEQLQELRSQQEKAKKKHEDLGKEKGLLERKHQQINQEINKFQGYKNGIDNEIAILQKGQLDVSKQKKSVENEINKFKKEKEKLKDLEESDKNLISLITDIEKQIKPSTDKLNHIESEINKIRGVNFEELKKKHADAKKEYNDLKKKQTEYDNIIENCPNHIEKYKKDIEAKAKAKEELASQIKSIQKELEEFVEKTYKIIEKRNEIKDKKEKCEEEFNELAKKSTAFKEKLIKINEEKKLIENDIMTIKVKCKDVNKKLNTKTSEGDDIKKSFNKSIEEFGFIDDIQEEIKQINEQRKARYSQAKVNLLHDDKSDKVSDANNSNNNNNNNDINSNELQKIDEVNEDEIVSQPKLKKKKKDFDLMEILQLYFNKELFLREISNEEFEMEGGLLSLEVRH